ncbi:MAG TPA: hypothetical protein VEW05_26610 [Candidatus Polarisedimenticolia bacterium]|nr:hypothetical protein [Candidatus Polarisedimenticolia bacterium]
MRRQAKLFSSSAGSVVRGYLKFRANITPRWIRNARTSRKHVEPEIVRSFRALSQLKKNRPRARIAIESAAKDLRAVLQRWETAYNKENFYRGIRILLELQRSGSSNL